MVETPKKIVVKNWFFCSFTLISQASIRVLGKSSVDIAHLIAMWIEIDLSMFSSSDPFVCNRTGATSGYFVLKKLKLICDPFSVKLG